ncbi:hypothetical protein [Motiliproteus sp.]|uniref:hypothetical protein n=1 Tax=Motiliproteus sp. TaxID=1898955 RepID=UPI003BAC7C36
MARAQIISAAKMIDNVGSMQQCLTLEQRILDLGLPLRQLHIDPLSTDWHSPEQPDHFRSGCGPIEALARARELVREGTPAVAICGEDNIKTGYARHQRLELMEIYGQQQPITEAYNALAQRFLQLHQIDESHFRQLAHALFDNYCLSYRNVLSDDFSEELLPDARWHQPLTSLFRGVDCANPLVDFQGRLLIVSDQLADQLDCPTDQRLDIRAVGLSRLQQDGPEGLEQIARYEHLESAYQDCCRTAGIDFADEFKAGHGLLEAYTCYPVVPMAFLLASGLVEVLEQIPEFLQRHSITVTGGMNLAKAAWNNPALNALISIHHGLLQGEERYGMVHGNGGLGYRQGVALLAKAEQ